MWALQYPVLRPPLAGIIAVNKRKGFLQLRAALMAVGGLDKAVGTLITISDCSFRPEPK